MAAKPTKQQIAQAKARAGGNNPVKVTNAGLKKLGSAAVIAATLTPAGRVLKTATTAVKTAKAAKAASIAQKKVYKEKVTIPAKRVVKAAKAELKSDARALKAANKPVSKGNRNIGGPVVRNIIKNSPPARANRTRLGNPAKKK